MAAKKRSPYLSQARLAAVVRYSPEEEAVAALLRQAQRSYNTNLATARAMGNTAGVIDAARPAIERIYRDAGLSSTPVEAPALPTGALDLASAAKFEAAAAQHRLSDARAAELTNLSDQRLAAHDAQVYGVANARKQLQSDIADVLTRKASLGREKGAYIASTLLDLQNQAAGRRVTIRGQNLSHQDRIRQQNLSHQDRVASRQARKRAAANAKLPGGAKPLPTSMQNTWVSNIRSIAQLVRDEVGKPVPANVTLPDGTVIKAGQVLTEHAARRLLTTKGNPLGRAFRPEEINAGFDVAMYKGLSRPNVVALHRAGVRVKGRFRILKPLTVGQVSQGVFGVGG